MYNQYSTSIGHFKTNEGHFCCTSHLYLLCQEGGLEVGLDHHLYLQLGAAHLTDQWDDAEGEDDVFSGAVPETKPLSLCACGCVSHSTDIHAHTLFTDLMSSYSPSGGMKLILRSESNLLRRTHWWNVQSSIAMDCFPLQQGTQRRETQQWATSRDCRETTHTHTTH